NGAGGSIADDDNAGLIACRQFETVNGKASAKIIAIGAAGPRCSNMLASLSQVDANAFPGLMSLGRKGRNWLRPSPKGAGKAVSKIAMTFAPKRGQHGDVMSTHNQWV